MCVSSWVDWTAAVQHNAVVRALYMISTEEWREEDKAVCGVGGGGVLPHHHHISSNTSPGSHITTTTTIHKICLKNHSGVCTLYNPLTPLQCTATEVFSHQNARVFPGISSCRNALEWTLSEGWFLFQHNLPSPYLFQNKCALFELMPLNVKVKANNN